MHHSMQGETVRILKWYLWCMTCWYIIKPVLINKGSLRYTLNANLIVRKKDLQWGAWCKIKLPLCFLVMFFNVRWNPIFPVSHDDLHFLTYVFLDKPKWIQFHLCQRLLTACKFMFKTVQLNSVYSTSSFFFCYSGRKKACSYLWLHLTSVSNVNIHHINLLPGVRV